MMTDREKVTLAFRNLRKLGYTAKQNFMCCGSCAWYELGGRALAGMRNEALPPAEKVVFYTKQGNDAWFERFNFGGKRYKTPTLQKDLYLQWAGNGALIKRILCEAGLNVEWNGTEEQAICIKAA